MTDTTTNTPDTATPAPADEKRQSVAKHELIAVAGGEHSNITESLGIRYTDKTSGDVFEYLLKLPESVAAKGVTIEEFAGSGMAMLALFGAKTKATNEASRVRNGQGGDTQAQFEAIDEVFDNIDKGVWREKAEGGGGTRTKLDVLARVLIDALGEKAQGTVDTYQNRLETDEAYRKKVWSNDAIKAAYKTAVGKTGPALTDLA